MNEPSPSLPADRVEGTRSIAAAAAIDGFALCGVLLGTLDHAQALVSIKEVATGRYVHVNTRMTELFGRSAAAMLGHTDLDWMEPAQAASIRTAEQAALVNDTPTLSAHRVERDGRKREFSVTRSALPREDGAPARHVLSVWMEQTSAHQREQQLQQALAQLEQQQVAAEVQRLEVQDQGLRDSATGLYQRGHFEDQLRREVDLSSREHREFALVSIALDPFTAAVAALGAPARVTEWAARCDYLVNNNNQERV